MAAEMAARGGTGGGRELATRVVVGAGLAAVALASVWVGGWVFFALLTIGTALAFVEWMRLDVLDRTTRAFIGGCVLGLAALSLFYLRERSGGDLIVCFVLSIVWGADIGAFTVGRLVGGPKLWTAISPSKTWAGLGGAVIGALTAMEIYGNVLDYFAMSTVVTSSDTRRIWFGVPAIVGLAMLAVLGDLFESALKRRAGVKDSGTLLPGHGGVLDRIDSLIPVAPAVAGAVALGWL